MNDDFEKTRGKMKRFLTILNILIIILSTSLFCLSFLEIISDNNKIISGYDIGRVAEKTSIGGEYEEYTTLKYNYSDLKDYNVFTSKAAPSTGKLNILVIPIWFSDSEKYFTGEKTKEKVISDLNEAYFGSEETKWKSLKSFYEEESLGKLEISGIIADPYECNELSSNYYYDDNDAGKTGDLANRVVKHYSETHNLNDFDLNNDGYIDALQLIYMSPNYQSLKIESTNLWAYTAWIQNLPGETQPTVNSYVWASYDFMYKYESLNLEGYLFPETYIHETGHLFGLFDLYDYTPIGQNGRRPAGGYSMQDENLGVHDPYSRISLGWFNKIYFVNKPCELKLNDPGDFVIMSNNFDGSPFNEYILIEFYDPEWIASGNLEIGKKLIFGKDVPDSVGYRVWHIDARLLQVENKNEEFFVNGLTTTIYDSDEHDLRYIHATSNSLPSGASIGHCSPVKEYQPYCLVKMIHYKIDKDEDSRPRTYFSKKSMFMEGSTFSIKEFKQYFFNIGKLDSYEKPSLKNGFNFFSTSKNNNGELRLQVSFNKDNTLSFSRI